MNKWVVLAAMVVATSGCRQLLRGVDDVARNSDVLVRNADGIGANPNVLKHMPPKTSLGHDLLKDAGLMVAELTAEQIAEWEPEDDGGEYLGRWKGTWQEGGLKVTRYCSRAKRTDVWWLRCDDLRPPQRSRTYRVGRSDRG